MIQKSNPVFGDSPDWYRNLKTHSRGDYFGSLRSLWVGQIFVTYDLKHIVYCDQNGSVTVSQNACAHAGAQLIDKVGEHSKETILCPVHQWLYKPDGNLISAPYFKLCEPIKLRQVESGVWNGYVIGYSEHELDAALSSFGSELGLSMKCFNPLEFDYITEIVDDVLYPRPLMMINYFDGLHVPLFHQKTFDAITDCSTYEWELSPSNSNHKLGYSIQVVRAKKDVRKHVERIKSLSKNDSEMFGWADLHLWIQDEIPNRETPIDRDIFAVWGAIYGNGHLMIELYEGGLFLAVSSLVNVDPLNPDTGNKNPVEFYIHKSIPEGFRDIAKRKFVDAYKQSADEDTALCKKLWQAHRLGGMDFKRAYHETLEKGDPHWREWFKRCFVYQG